MASKSQTVSSTSVGVLKRHEKMLDTIGHGTENEAIALFSKEGYDVNTKVEYTFDDRKKYLVTPLAWAVRYKRPQLCRYLLQNGADPYSTLIYDYYPLHEACNRGFDDIVKIFIDMKCNINRVTSDNHSPLHIACMRGNIECARLLLESGANRHVRNNHGRSPLELGIYHGQSDLHELFSYYSKPRIQRRHSLHSPTGEPRHPMKQLSSFDSGVSYRPQSMLIDFSDDRDGSKMTGIDELAFRTLQIPNGPMNRIRSQSNQNLASGSGYSQGSFVAQPHTCTGMAAPTNSQLQVTLAPVSLITSTSLANGRPTLMSQFSQASSCAADSPSPVERDGVLGKNDSTVSAVKLVKVECRILEDGDSAVSAASGNDQCQVSPERPTKRAIKSPSLLGVSLKSSVPYRNKAAPSHSISNPEFPLMAHISMSHTERTHSFDNLYDKQRQHPPFQQHPEAKITPSREKINHLSSQLYSSLDQSWATNLSAVPGSYQHVLKDSCVGPAEVNPVGEVMQKIINVTAPLLHLNQAHIQTLMQLSTAYSQGHGETSHPPLNAPLEGETVYESPVAYLLSFGYKMVDKPLTVMFGVPSDGYMTLTFRLIDESIQSKDALLKVVTKIFDLKNKYESSTYHHSIEEGSFSSVFPDNPTSPQLQEINVLAHLHDFPHPNIVEMTDNFKANTNEQHELFAHQMNPEKPKKMYTTGRVADFMILQSPRVHLKEYLGNLRTMKKSVRSSEVFPETMVLSVLSQVLLAAGHLVHNQVAHCAVSSSSVLIDENNSGHVVLSNFSHAVQLNFKKQDLEGIHLTHSRLKSDLDNSLRNRHCVLSPEVVDAVDNSKLETALQEDKLRDLFSKNDSYSAGWMIYSWFLSNSHAFICQRRVKPYSYSEIPYLSEFSPQCNHLLKKLVAYDAKERLDPMKAAMACFILIFGPAIADVKTEEESYKWLLAETVEFYMRPVLVDSKVKDYTDSLSKLLCLYLTIASTNPKRVWEACRFFSEC